MLYDVVLLDPNMNALAPVTISTNEKCARVDAEILAAQYDRNAGIRNSSAGRHTVYSVKTQSIEQP